MKHFIKRNDPFKCVKCGASVQAATRTCRNHCPFCLHSLHVDINPGDRANPCRGLLIPCGYKVTPKKGLIILFQCERCGTKTQNIALRDDPIQPDDYQRILSLTP